MRKGFLRTTVSEPQRNEDVGHSQHKNSNAVNEAARIKHKEHLEEVIANTLKNTNLTMRNERNEKAARSQTARGSLKSVRLSSRAAAASPWRPIGWRPGALFKPRTAGGQRGSREIMGTTEIAAYF